MWEKVKSYVAYVGAALLAILTGVIYILLGMRRKDQDEIASLKSAKNIQELEGKKNEAEQEAKDSEDDYKRSRDAYFKSFDDAGGDRHP